MTKTIKRFVLSVAAIFLVSGLFYAFTASAQTGSATSTQTNSKESSTSGCVGCDDLPQLERRRTGISEVDAAISEENRQKILAWGKQRAEKIQAENMRNRENWRGVQVVIPVYDPKEEHIYAESKAMNPKFTPPPKRSKEELADLEMIAEVFKKNPPAPKQRLAAFAKYLVPGAPDKCVGYTYVLCYLTTVDDGWLVTLSVSPDLVGPEARPSHVWGLDTVEVWHIDVDGTPSCISVKAYGMGNPVDRSNY